MCGRYVSSASPERLAEYFDVVSDAAPLEPSFNVAPTDDVYGIVAHDDAHTRRLRVFRWGLVPAWADDPKVGARMINARAETLRSSNAFKRSFTSKRALIPMDGFYEWRASPASGGAKPAKQPLFFHRPDGEPLAVAGLWAAWRDRDHPDGAWLHSCTIITTQPNALAATVHDRMPAILLPGQWDAWLDPDHHDLDALARLLGPAPDDLLVADEVDVAVGNVGNNGPELIRPLNSK